MCLCVVIDYCNYEQISQGLLISKRIYNNRTIQMSTRLYYILLSYIQCSVLIIFYISHLSKPLRRSSLDYIRRVTKPVKYLYLPNTTRFYHDTKKILRI